jgi:hypothetical protein
MKQQDNHSPSKANSTTKDLSTHIKEEITNTEFQKTKFKKLINDLKEETQKLTFDLKKDANNN